MEREYKIGKTALWYIVFRECEINDALSMAEYRNGGWWVDSRWWAKTYVVKTDAESVFIIIKARAWKDESTSES